jgi:DNA-binding NtrC family response regulator
MSFKQSPDSVIVAENNPVARASLTDLLSLDGYRVFQADNVKAALSCINRVDDLKVLLADLDMFGWRSIIRHAVRTTNAFVIAMEGSYPFSKIYDLKERGVGACLRKPIIYNDLRAAIRENVGRRNATDLIPPR